MNQAVLTIQKIYRGKVAREMVKAKYGFQTKSSNSFRSAATHDESYAKEVEEIRNKLGLFNFGD